MKGPSNYPKRNRIPAFLVIVTVLLIGKESDKGEES